MGPLSPPLPTLTADPQPRKAALETGALEMRGLKRRPCAALGAPFSPLCQLLSVLPPQSGDLVPLAYRELMLSPSSPIYDAFPVDFALDANGARTRALGAVWACGAA